MVTETRSTFGFVFASIAIVVTIFACYGTDVTKPPEGPNTSYPCGVWSVECSNGACCPWAHICGVEGDPWRRCEVGYCCADADPLYGSSPEAGAAVDAGRSVVIPQRRPR